MTLLEALVTLCVLLDDKFSSSYSDHDVSDEHSVALLLLNSVAVMSWHVKAFFSNFFFPKAVRQNLSWKTYKLCNTITRVC